MVMFAQLPELESAAPEGVTAQGTSIDTLPVMTEPVTRVRMFVLDSDNTVENSPDAERFKALWELLDPKLRPLLVYNSGRAVEDTRWRVLEQAVPAAEFIIGSLGTEVFDPIDSTTGPAFTTPIATGWDRNAVARIVDEIPAARVQPPEFQTEFKASWHWHRATPAEKVRLEVKLRDAGLEVGVLYTNSVCLGVIPLRAGKGKALAWLCERNGMPLSSVLAAGAAANNVEMFKLPEVQGFLLGDAAGELCAGSVARRPFTTPPRGAEGIVAGLRHFGVISTELSGRRTAVAEAGSHTAATTPI